MNIIRQLARTTRFTDGALADLIVAFVDVYDPMCMMMTFTEAPLAEEFYLYIRIMYADADGERS